MTATDGIETALLGALLLEGDQLPKAFSLGLKSGHFLERKHQILYAAMLVAFDRSLPIDAHTLSLVLREIGKDKEVDPQYLADLVAAVTSSAHIPYHAGIVIRQARVRDLMALSRRMLDDLPSIDVTSDEALGSHLTAMQAAAADGLQPLSSSVEPIIVPSSDFTPVEPEWLWYPYLPRNKLAFLEGDPGNGKTFLALHIAACITTGRALYRAQPTEPGNVLYLSAEDGLADTLALRLERAGADRSRVYHIQGVRRQGQIDEAIYFNDRDVLRKACDKINPKMIVWDPMQAFFQSEVNINAANETRPYMTALRELSEEFSTSMLVIRHHRKGAGAAIAKGMGSMDLSGAARSVLVVGIDQENPAHRVLAHAKSSLAKAGDSLKFELVNTAVSWLGTVETSADDLALGEQQPKCSDAVEFLREALAVGPREVKDIEGQAKAQGISVRTLDRARSRLHVKSSRLHPKSPWVIELPHLNGHVEIVKP